MRMGLRSLFRVLTPCLLLGIGLGGEATQPQSAQAAEEIRLLVGGPLSFSVSVDSLAAFAQTGEVADDLRLFLRFANEPALAGLQNGLQAQSSMTVQQLSNLGYSALGEDALANVGVVIRPHKALNGDRALRGAMIGAAAQARSDGRATWTPLDVLNQYPGKIIDVRLQDLLALRRWVTDSIDGTQSAIALIQAQAANEIAQAASNQNPLPENLAASGPYPIEADTFTLTRSALRQTRSGLQTNYSFDVDIYAPQGLSQPAPVVIVSHGYSDTKENFSYIGRHLASHGFVVLLPEHVGSDLDFRLGYTAGLVNTAMEPSEFISRPTEISHLIDQLEQWTLTSPKWAELIDLDRIGVVGHSLGGATAHSLVGADINPARLRAACNRVLGDTAIGLNFSMYLQCQARFLTSSPSDLHNRDLHNQNLNSQNLNNQNRIDQSLRDPRIKAVISANGLSSALYGPEGMGQIDIPFMMVSSAKDVIAPSLAEQIQPFFWVGSDKKYLALMAEGSHFSFTAGDDPRVVSPFTHLGDDSLLSLVIGGHREVGSRYFQALNVAFWTVYLKEDESYLPYLSAGYGAQLSEDEPVPLTFVRSLNAEDF